jgi:hypothetical protein
MQKSTFHIHWITDVSGLYRLWQFLFCAYVVFTIWKKNNNIGFFCIWCCLFCLCYLLYFVGFRFSSMCHGISACYIQCSVHFWLKELRASLWSLKKEILQKHSISKSNNKPMIFMLYSICKDKDTSLENLSCDCSC